MFSANSKFSISVLCVAVAFVLIATNSLSAEITLIADDHVVSLDPQYAWTVSKTSKAGRYISNNHGSAQGSVIRVDEQWAGSKHGNEQLLNVRLLVDGTEQYLSDGQSYYGNHIEFSRTSILGGAYKLTSTMTITPDWSNEHITFEGLDASKTVKNFYGFLGSRTNRMISYAGFDSKGSRLFTGNTNKDDNIAVGLEASNIVAQYDPLNGDGILSIVTSDEDVGLLSFIWDRSIDNKLYFIMQDAHGLAYPTNYFELDQTLYFFKADPDNWLDSVSGLIPNPELIQNPEPGTIFLLGIGSLVFFRKRR